MITQGASSLLGDTAQSDHLGDTRGVCRRPVCYIRAGGTSLSLSCRRQVSPTTRESFERWEGERLGDGGKASKEWKPQRRRLCPSVHVRHGH